MPHMRGQWRRGVRGRARRPAVRAPEVAQALNPGVSSPPGLLEFCQPRQVHYIWLSSCYSSETDMTTDTVAEHKPFQAEVAELLHLMVHSVYSETEFSCAS